MNAKRLLLLLVLLASPAMADTNDALFNAMDKMAADIVKAMAKDNLKSVVVGSFGASTEVNGSSGPEIQVKLTEALKKHQAVIDEKNPQAEVMGKYLPFFPNPNSRDPLAAAGKGVKISATLIDKSAGSEIQFHQIVTGQEAVPRLLGLTATYDDTENRHEVNKKALAPETRFYPPAGDHVPSAPTEKVPPGQYQVFVMVNGTPRPQSPGKRGDPFCELEPGEAYTLKIVNNTDRDAAAAVSIDGLNIFKFNTINPNMKYYIVPAHGFTEIKGWYKDTKANYRFLVTPDLSQTAVAECKLKFDAIGTICVSFCDTWDPVNKPSWAKGARSVGTARGDEFPVESKIVKRDFGAIKANICVRYDRKQGY